MSESQVTKREPGGELMVQPEMTPGSVLAMAQATMRQGLTAENVAVVEKMFALAERVDARMAEKRPRLRRATERA